MNSTTVRRLQIGMLCCSLFVLLIGLYVLGPQRKRAIDPLGIPGALAVEQPPEADSLYRVLDRCLGRLRETPLASIRWVESDSIPARFGESIRPGLAMAGVWIPEHSTILLKRSAIQYEPERLELLAHEITHARTLASYDDHPVRWFSKACGNNGTFVFGVPTK